MILVGTAEIAHAGFEIQQLRSVVADADAQVVNRSGAAIDGLYAAGLVQANGSMWRIADYQGQIISNLIVAEQQAPEGCAYGAVVFRCASLAAISSDGTQPIYTRLLLTGYRNYFLKLRVDWRQNSPDDTTEVERMLQTFVGTVLRS